VTTAGNENGEPMQYESDEYGFNNPPGTSQLKLKEAENVFLGDSFAQGQCVNSDSGFVARVRSSHPATVNLGVAGNGPLLMLAGLEEYAARWRPRRVFWCFFEGNDLELDLENEKRCPLLRRYCEPGFTQGLASRQVSIDSLLASTFDLQVQRAQEATSKRTGPSLRSSLSMQETRGRLGLRLPPRVDLPLFQEILRVAAARVASWNGRMVFVYLPDWIRYGQPRLASPYRDAVLAIARNSGLDVIDVDTTFRSQLHPLDCFPFGLPGHYCDRGHRLIAERLLTYMKDTSLGPN
jgi:hypothetical protein